jgi:hypothetical protein
MYTRTQIEDMSRAATRKKQVEDGRKFLAWLRLEVAPSCPPVFQPLCVELADEVSRLYPTAQIPGLPGLTAYQVSSLYRLQPPEWLRDGLVCAFGERLEQFYPGVKCAPVVEAVKVTARRKAKLFSPAERDRLRALAADEGATHVVVPVNFADYHWSCAMVCL